MARASTTEWQPVPLRDRPFAKEMGEHRVWTLLFLRATGLQGMHPVVAQGIVDYSHIWTNPTGRIPETIRYGLMLHLGEDTPGTAAEIREIHRDMKGTLDDGSTYHAWGREVWLWVHLTAVESMLFALEHSFGPLDPASVDEFYARTRDVGMLYGIREQDLPLNVADMRAYVDARLQEFEPTEATRQLQAFFEAQSEQLLPGPEIARKTIGKALGPWVRNLAYGSFPPVIRDKWGVSWGPRDEKIYQATLRIIRLTGLLPARVRLVPQAYESLSKAGLLHSAGR